MCVCVEEAVEARSWAERECESVLYPSKCPLLASGFLATGLKTRTLVLPVSQARFLDPGWACWGVVTSPLFTLQLHKRPPLPLSPGVI